MLKEYAGEIGCEVIALEVTPDHVHVFLRTKPNLSPAKIINHLKGKTARKLLQEFPELMELWSRSYFVATVGHVTDGIVEHYTEIQ